VKALYIAVMSGKFALFEILGNTFTRGVAKRSPSPGASSPAKNKRPDVYEATPRVARNSGIGMANIQKAQDVQRNGGVG